MVHFLNTSLLNWSSPETTILSNELLRLEKEIQRLSILLKLVVVVDT